MVVEGERVLTLEERASEKKKKNGKITFSMRKVVSSTYSSPLAETAAARPRVPRRTAVRDERLGKKEETFLF